MRLDKCGGAYDSCGMAKSLNGMLVVAISSRALFDFESENRVFDASGEAEYMKLQLDRVDVPATRGVGFNLCKKLLAFNAPERQHVEVVILSRNDPITALRIFHSARHHGLSITRGAFLRGDDPYPYLVPLRAQLFLSANPKDVRSALDIGFPAANVFAREVERDPHPEELRIAFDGDSVLFSDEAERVFKEKKLEGFMQHEVENANQPLPAGPLKPFLDALLGLQNVPKKEGAMRIRTALITARGAPAHERALRTLHSWNVSVDQAFFLDGLEKAEFLKVFQPDFFFDDQLAHIDPAKDHVCAGHVPSGIANQ